MTHLINRLQFDVQCTDEDTAFQLRHQFAQVMQAKVAEVVDAVCSKYAGDEEWIKIDKLEINLSKCTAYSLENNFAANFRYLFEKEIAQKITTILPSQKQASQNQLYTELLTGFLQKGSLPWWAQETAVDLNDVMQSVISNYPDVIKSFLYEYRFNSWLWQRVAWQFNAAIHKQIITVFSELENGNTVLNDLVKAVMQANNATVAVADAQGSIIQKIVLENAIVFFQGQDTKATVYKIANNNIDKLFPVNLQQAAAAFIPADEEKTTVQQSVTALPLLNTEYNGSDEDKTEKFSVRTAGIVLAAPFLQSFFKKLELLEGAGFKNNEARYKAIHLLKFLGTGQQNCAEYDLQFEKILCGTPANEPVPADIVLAAAEMNEAGLLLASMLEHWKALKNTTVEGLRETFFKRDGLISRKENGWLLQIERKTWDVLLDGIPWGYSTIMLPWNGYLIYAEW